MGTGLGPALAQGSGVDGGGLAVGASGVAGTVAPLWTPADISGSTGLRWYKSDDSATITESSGLVDELADKYPGGYDLAGVTTTRPTTGSSTLNGKNVLDLSGDFLTAAAASDWKFMHDGTTWMFAALAKIGTTADPDAAIGLFGTNRNSTNNVGVSMLMDDRSSQSRNEMLSSSVTRGVTTTHSALVQSNNELEPDQWLLILGYYDPDNATPALRSRFEVNRGRRLSSNTESNSVSAANPTFPFQLGAVGDANLPMTGQFAELVITSDWADGVNLAQYLVREWGLPYTRAFDVAQTETIAAA